jgi:hypothetical protein
MEYLGLKSNNKKNNINKYNYEEDEKRMRTTSIDGVVVIDDINTNNSMYCTTGQFSDQQGVYPPNLEEVDLNENKKSKIYIL